MSPEYVHSWASQQKIYLDYRRPSKSWLARVFSPELLVVLTILAVGLVSGLLAVFLWSKLAPPGREGFQYARLPENTKKAKPQWV
jgi:hypothetical protein